MKPRAQKNTGVTTRKNESNFTARGTSPVPGPGASTTVAAAERPPRARRASPQPQPPAQVVPREEISARAHAIWEREGKPHGREIEHWLRAEAELRMEKSLKS